MFKRGFVALALAVMFASSGCVFHAHRLHCSSRQPALHEELFAKSTR